MEGGGNSAPISAWSATGLAPGRGRLALEGLGITTGYPEFDSCAAEEARLVGRADREREKRSGRQELEDRSVCGIIRVAMKNHGCSPSAMQRARAVVWNFPDPIPIHREALYSPRPDLVAKYPEHDDVKVFWRLPTSSVDPAAQRCRPDRREIPA